MSRQQLALLVFVIVWLTFVVLMFHHLGCSNANPC